MEKMADLHRIGYPTLSSAVSTLNVDHVFISEYSGNLFSDSQGNIGSGCEIFDSRIIGVSRDDAKALEKMRKRLNTEIRDVANTNHWHFIGTLSRKFEKHGYCSNDPYYVKAKYSCKNQGDFNGTMHPNIKGTRVIAGVIAVELKKYLSGPLHSQTVVAR